MTYNPFAADRALRDLRDITLTEDAELIDRTSMKTRSRAAILAEPHHPGALRDLLRLARERDWPTMVLGGGFNTIFATDYFEGIVVVLDPETFGVIQQTGENILTVGAAANLYTLMRELPKAGLMGLEYMTMIPGTVGGALAGNAGAAGMGLCDAVERVVYMTRSGKVRQLRRGEFHYGYRHSELCEAIVLEADLLLERRVEEVARRRTKEFVDKKKGQPYGVPSSGCIFKNPIDPQTGEPVSAGKIIDQCGLKGYELNNAEVSEGHANFIVNRGDATGDDFLAMISLVRDIVLDRTGIELEIEARIVGGPLTSCVLR